MRREKKTKPALWTTLPGSQWLPAKARTFAARFRGANARGLLRAAYNRRAKEWLDGKQCAGCLRVAVSCEDDHYVVKAATEVHHKHGRGWRGELLLAEDLWLPLCRRCHRWAHDNPDAARAAGLLAPAGEWNRRPS